MTRGTRHAISLYITSYNQAGYLRAAIESVLAQTRMPDQLIIIDDASSDESPQLIRDYQRRHPDLIDAVLRTQNMGIGASRAQAVGLARGDLITYLDGDDLYAPQKLELEERALIEQPDAAYAYSNFEFINPDGERTGLWCEPSQAPPSGNLFDQISGYKLMRGVCHRCELMRTDVLRRAGSYEPGLNLYEDYDLKLRVSREHNAVAVDRVTHSYRMHPQGLHRISYARHFDALEHVYAKNAPLIDSLPPDRRGAVRRGVNRVLARHAWRAVKQCAAGEIALKPMQTLRYASSGVKRRPGSLLLPKHPVRTVRALTGL